VAALNHPNIVTIYSVEKAEGRHFLTMELVEGSSLRELIPEGGFPLEEFLDLGLQLADAVGAAHRSSITHRDLKPDNIMIDRDGRVKVLDFGLAKLKRTAFEGEDPSSAGEDDLTADGEILGTVAYMSPEQAEGRKVDSRSDVFSLGIILYQMATGERPFRGSSKVSTLVSILKDTPPPISDLRPVIPPDLARIVERCLAKDPGERYDTALEVRDALQSLREVTISGIRPARPAARRRLLPILAAAAAAVVVVGLIAVRWGRSPGSGAVEPSVRSVAVLPFANLSTDPENEYFADGITEEITSKLSRISGLEVASRTSVTRFKGTDLDPQTIGRRLGVRYLLEGSVRKAGHRVRITAQLVDTVNGFQLWSEDFEGLLDDVFRVQEETALKIADALDLRLSPGERQAVRHRYTTNPQAYDAYLRGRALLEYFNTPEKLEAARTNLERALELDPDYPLALVGLSRVEAQYYRNLDPNRARLVRAERLARSALDLEPQMAEAHLALAQVHGNRWEYEKAAQRCREAARLEPGNAYAWDLLSWALGYQQPPQAEAAEEAARKAISLQASLIGAHYHLGRALVLQGRYDEAMAAFEQVRILDSDFESADFGRAQVLLAQDRPEEARQVLVGLTGLREAPVLQVQLCFTNAALGESEAALAALRTALERGYRDAPALRASPYLSELRSSPA